MLGAVPVTGAGAVSVLTHRPVPVITGFVVAGMAPGAIGLVTRCGPGDRLRIGLVARGARRVAAVIARIGRRRVSEHQCRPVRSLMTGVALQRCSEVIARCARGLCAIVAIRTGSQHVVVVHPDHGNPGRGTVAVLTQVVGLDVLGVLSGGGGAVVAAGAVAGHVAVIERRTRPAVGGVTVVAGVAAGDMVGGLAGGHRAVVTREAGPDDIGVVDPQHGNPGGGAVAVLAQVVGLDVLGVLSGGGGAVVAADTIGTQATMVEPGITPVIGSMAVFTL